MEKPKRAGYSIISSYIILSLILGLSGFQYYLDSQESPIYHVKKEKTQLNIISNPNKLIDSINSSQLLTYSLDSLNFIDSLQVDDPKNQDTIPILFAGICEPIDSIPPEPIIINLDTIGQLINYPIEAKNEDIEGEVIIRVILNHKGIYQKHKVIKSSNILFTEAVEKHIRKLRFSPLIHKDTSRLYNANLPFTFKLD